MTTLEETTTTVWGVEDETFDEAQLAAVAFLARYSGRTLDAYRHDLRAFFQWATDKQLIVLKATRPHIELYRAAMEERGLAASTIDRRLSTGCGFYRFAHIDGRIAANPAQYVRRPKVQPSEGHGMDRAELGTFLFTAERFDRDHAALAVLLGLNGLRVSEACGTNIEDLALQRGHRTLRILGKGNKPATIPLVPRTARTIDLVVGERHEGRFCAAKTGNVWIVVPRIGGSVRSASARVSEWSIRTCSAPGSSWPRSTPECPYATYRSPPATPTRARRPATTDVERTSTGTPPTSSSRSSPAGDASHSSSGTSGTVGCNSPWGRALPKRLSTGLRGVEAGENYIAGWPSVS